MYASTTRPSHPPRTTSAIVLALVLLVSLAVGGVVMQNMGRIAPGTQIPQDALATQGEPVTQQVVAKSRSPALASGPGWELMTTPQKLALYPLAERWAYLSEAQKRHWLVLAQSFGAMPEAEQERLHTRMAAWANLNAQQRNQARINFAVTRNLAPRDIQSEWETYQALSETVKQHLAAKAPKPKGAATALKPRPSKRLAHVPSTEAQENAANPPKIVFPEPSAVRALSSPEATALPPTPPASSSDNSTPAQPSPASETSTTPADPLPPVYIN